MRSTVSVRLPARGPNRSVSNWISCLVMALLPGCSQPAQPVPRVPTLEQTIEAAISQLSPADQVDARLQKVCAVAGEPLGSMGVPVKLMLEGQPVFLCCEACRSEVQSRAADILARRARLTGTTNLPYNPPRVAAPASSPETTVDSSTSAASTTSAPPQSTVESQTTTP